MSENRVIGRAGTLPWHLSADLKRFKKLTMGHAIVMGRKTYESIGRPLPGRASIVLSRDPKYVIAGTDVVENLEQALAKTKEEEVFVIGGAQLYEIALPLAERLYLTEVGTTIDGDVFSRPVIGVNGSWSNLCRSKSMRKVDCLTASKPIIAQRSPQTEASHPNRLTRDPHRMSSHQQACPLRRRA